MHMKKIIADLQGLGVTPSDTLLVHSSLKSLGRIEGGAITVIQSLIAALPKGNLLMPTLTYEYVTKDSPRFSSATTPSCVGLIPETFRKYPGVVRSIHPTHSVCAYGVNAAEITANHHLDRTPVGENSPFRQLLKYNGKILMLGCGLRPNTSMHGVEETAKAPYVLQSTPTKLYVDDEAVFHYKHNFSNGGITQRYDRVAEVYEIKKGKILDADVYIMEAKALWAAASAKMTANPYFFVDMPQ